MGQNAAEAVESLMTQFPVLRTHLTNSRGNYAHLLISF